MSFRLFQSLFSAPASQVVRREKGRKKYTQSRFLLRQSNVKRESKIARKEPDKTSGC